MENIINQFLNDKGRFITNFKTIEDVEEQKKKVRDVIRQTTIDSDFDNLHMYYQTLKYLISDILYQSYK